MSQITIRSLHKRVVTVAATASSLALFSLPAQGQNAGRTLPRPIEPNPSPTTLTPLPQPQAPADSGLVLEKLVGINVIEDPSDLSRPGLAGTLLVPSILAQQKELAALIEARMGRPLLMADLDVICARIVEEYRALGRPVVDALVPEQDVTAGIVRILVIEGKLGEVRVEGIGRARIARKLASQIRIKPGDPIDSKTLLDDLDWFNRSSPFRSVNLLFGRSARAGVTDIILRASEPTCPLRAYASYDNTGSSSTGEDRYVAGFNWGDAFGLGLDHQLGYQFTTGEKFDRFQAHGFTYIAPLPNRDIVSLFGTWSQTKPALADARLDSTGESFQLSGRYEIPLRRKLGPNNRFRQTIEFGIDLKRSNNNLEFGGESVFDRATDTVQFEAAYRFEDSDTYGSTRGRAAITLSPGGITSNNDSDAFEISRTGADAAYAYVTASLDRRWRLPHEMTLITHARAQASSGALLSGEQFGFGGADTVRGYPERAFNGDSGVSLSVELESPGINVLPMIGVKRWEDDLRFFAFVDAGLAWNYHADDSNPSSLRALSVGPGIRYRIGSNFNLEVSYGVRLDDNGIDDSDSGRHHVSIMGTLSW